MTTADASCELVLDARCATGESPVWPAGGDTLWWVDIPAKVLHAWSAAAGHRRWSGPQMLACLAPLADGSGFLGAMEDTVARLRPGADGMLASEPVAQVRHDAPAMRFNDGRCDRQGRFLAGTMCLDMAAGIAAGRLYQLRGGRMHSLLDGLIVPNGLAFSPDGRRMYLSDSHPQVQQVWVFDYDPATGMPSNRRPFIDFRALPGRPDGAAIDVDGGYWICGNDAGLVHRFTPQGRLDRSLAVPVKKPAMCAFGGPRLDTLYVTSIRPGGDVADQPLAGGVFALAPGTQGMPEPAWDPDA